MTKKKSKPLLCAAGKHELTSPGACELCDHEETATLLDQKCPHGVRTSIEDCTHCKQPPVFLTPDEAESCIAAVVGLRQLLQLAVSPLAGLDGLPFNSPAAQMIIRAQQTETLLRKAQRRAHRKTNS